MPRKKRICRSGMFHHVMLRGIDGRATFMDDQDRNRFCLLLQEASELCLFKIHAFCLMTNHVHLVIEPTEVPLSSGVHRFSSRYAQYFNSKHKRRGYVFQGRFRSIIVEGGCYLRRLVRYVHLNPVEAKLASHPSQYTWCSYNAYFNKASFTWLHIDSVLRYFGNTRPEALAKMAIHLDGKIDPKAASIDHQELANAFRKGVYGSEEFVKIYSEDDCCSVVKHSSEEKFMNIKVLVEAVCQQCNVTIDELRSAEKRQELVRARAICARAAQLINGLELRNVCEVLDKHHGTVSRLASKAREDMQLMSTVNLVIDQL